MDFHLLITKLTEATGGDKIYIYKFGSLRFNLDCGIIIIKISK